MNFSHWSKTPTGTNSLSLRQQDAALGDFNFTRNPNGLWVSVDGEDDWEAWCTSEEFGGLGPYRYRVGIDLEHVLVLNTAQAIRDFGLEWKRDPNPLTAGIFPPSNARYHAIDWVAVAQKYDGIIIAPYQWDVRMELLWYYGWDCASGCIWNPEVITRMELVS